jgi:pimeloyl-ACP methyl ester carboxylesterase
MQVSSSSISQVWQWNGYKIHYVRAGQKNKLPSLLLVHGFGASTDHWRKNIEELQQDFEVWAIDLLGFGRSAKPNIEYSGQLWQNQLTDFIKEVIQNPVVIVGNSLGGYASLCVSANEPEYAVGTVLLNSAGPFSEVETQKSPFQTILSKVTRTFLLQPLFTRLIFEYTRNRSNIRKTLEKVYLDKSAVTDQLVEDIYRPSCDPGAAEVFASVFKSPQGNKIDILLAQLSSPLLLLWGEGDPWMRVKERGIKFRQYYPSATEHYLQAGHCPHDEIPDQVNNLIKNWMLENFKY